jgi:hypothetical protein
MAITNASFEPEMKNFVRGDIIDYMYGTYELFGGSEVKA